VEREVRERWIIDSAGLDKIVDKMEKTLKRVVVLETLNKQQEKNER